MIKTIEVTQDDIERGFPRCSVACPIALAASRAFPEWGEARVYIGEIVFFKTEAEATLTIYLPENAQRFVNTYDSDGAVEPFSFRVFAQ